uniref:USP domain-containing protein n=1 Tax=Meloidogyne hapla TaxID=6305 RepID=A0A1I8AWV0_MELHA
MRRFVHPSSDDIDNTNYSLYAIINNSLIGMKNGINRCFAIAPLQALLHTEKFKDSFLNKDQLARKINRNEGKKGALAGCISGLFNYYWLGNEQTYDTDKIMVRGKFCNA